MEDFPFGTNFMMLCMSNAPRYAAATYLCNQARMMLVPHRFRILFRAVEQEAMRGLAL